MAEKQHQSISESLSGIASGVRRLGKLYIDKARLQATEKVTILLSTVAFTAVVVALAIVLMVFVSIGVGHLLAATIAPHWAYLIVAGFYLILLALILFLRRPLFIDPIARFMSRLMVEPPREEEDDEPMIPRSEKNRQQANDMQNAEPEESSESEINLYDIDAESEAVDKYDEVARKIAVILKNSAREKSDDNTSGHVDHNLGKEAKKDRHHKRSEHTDPADAVVEVIEIEDMDQIIGDDTDTSNIDDDAANDTKGGIL